MEPMNTPRQTSPKPRIGQILTAGAVAVGGTVAAMYALNRLRRHRKTQALLDTLPPSTDAGIQDNTAAPADDTFDPAQITTDIGPDARLEDLRFDELYQLAQHRDIRGRSAMRKSELMDALRHFETN